MDGVAEEAVGLVAVDKWRGGTIEAPRAVFWTRLENMEWDEPDSAEYDRAGLDENRCERVRIVDLKSAESSHLQLGH